VSGWHIAHLLVLGLWGGLVLAETVVELSARDDEGIRVAARIHYWIDVSIELPLLAGVLLTGAVLTARAWPLSHVHVAKIALALFAIGCNLYCAVHVLLRHRRADAVDALRHHNTRVRWSFLGLPAGLGALTIGFVYFVP